MTLEFGPFTLDIERAELRGPAGTVAMEPKAFAVLRLLVDHNDRVVSRGEMIDAVWGGRFISDAAVSTALKLARRALGDDGIRQQYIRTVHGTGHRFVAPVVRHGGPVGLAQGGRGFATNACGFALYPCGGRGGPIGRRDGG